MKYLIQDKKIGNKTYEYVYCVKCEVWIRFSNFNFETGEHKSCKKYQQNKDIRKRAESKAIGRIRIRSN